MKETNRWSRKEEGRQAGMASNLQAMASNLEAETSET